MECLLVAVLLVLGVPDSSTAKSYSSGGRSYSSHSSSSHSSSHSSSSGSSRSSSSGSHSSSSGGSKSSSGSASRSSSSGSSGGSSKSFSSGSHSYSSGGSKSSSDSSPRSSSSSGGSSKSFSSGTHSYSSDASKSSSDSSPRSSSSSSSSGSSPSYRSGSHSSSSGNSSPDTASSSDSSKSYRSGTGKSYSSGSTWSDSSRHSYSSGKSYSSGIGRFFSSEPTPNSAPPSTPAPAPRRVEPDSSSSSMTFDTAAARALKEQESKQTFSQYKASPSSTPNAVDLGPARSGSDSAPPSTPAPAPRRVEPDSSSSGMTFDTAAARALKEQESKQTFSQYKASQSPAPKSADVTSARSEPASASTPSYRVQPPPIPSSSGSSRTTYIPDTQVVTTRPVRVDNVFNPYYSRPVVVYRDPYGSLFWWWLLDRSLDERAYWAYHHRNDMDPWRYQALVDNDRQLEARVAELEAQQAPRDPNYTPAGLDQDLMYSDQHVARVYSNRPTTVGVLAFWALGIPLVLAFFIFFIWLIWFKRWQPAT